MRTMADHATLDTAVAGNEFVGAQKEQAAHYRPPTPRRSPAPDREWGCSSSQALGGFAGRNCYRASAWPFSVVCPIGVIGLAVDTECSPLLILSVRRRALIQQVDNPH